MPDNSIEAAEDTPKREGEIVASLSLLWNALRTPAGLAGLGAAILLPVVSYVHYRPMDFGLTARGVLPQGWHQFPWIGVNILALLVVPLLVVRFGLKERVADYGMTLGDWRVQLKHGLVFLLVVVPVIFIASRLDDFARYYPMFSPARANAWLLIPWELAYGAYFFAWEFFFRGFLLQGFAKKLGPAAIALQTVPFVLMHVGKPEPELYASVIAGLALGVTGYRSRSFVGCWLVHWICAASMDIFALI